MDFISLTFALFFVLSVAAYYIVPKNNRWLILLGASMIFYVWATPGLVIFLLFSALSTYLFAVLANRYPCQKKGLLILTIALNVGILVFLKFYNLGAARLKLPVLSLVMPMGISFYTLQIIGYCVDVYRGKITAQRNFAKYFLFVAFFPQILQGPIPRYDKLAEQLYEGHSFDYRTFKYGFQLILWGLFLKMVIADRAAIFVNTVFPDYRFYGGTLLAVAAVLYSIQLYTDFLGCVCIAMGAAGVYGIHLETNFKTPYFAVSIKDFWRRWHISLSSWLRDYVYIPLGGNRKGTFRKYVNLILTFLVSGIWHGAGLNFMFWGLLHGGWQVAGEVLLPVRGRVKKLLKIQEESKAYRIFCQVFTFSLVTAGWVIFRAESLRAGLGILKRIVFDITPWIFWNGALFGCGISAGSFAALLLSILLAWGVECFQQKHEVRPVLEQQHILVRWGFYLGVIALIAVLGVYGPGYSASQFLYGQF